MDNVDANSDRPTEEERVRHYEYVLTSPTYRPTEKERYILKSISEARRKVELYQIEIQALQEVLFSTALTGNEQMTNRNERPLSDVEKAEKKQRAMRVLEGFSVELDIELEEVEAMTNEETFKSRNGREPSTIEKIEIEQKNLRSCRQHIEELKETESGIERKIAELEELDTLETETDDEKAERESAISREGTLFMQCDPSRNWLEGDHYAVHISSPGTPLIATGLTRTEATALTLGQSLETTCDGAFEAVHAANGRKLTIHDATLYLGQNCFRASNQSPAFAVAVRKLGQIERMHTGDSLEEAWIKAFDAEVQSIHRRLNAKRS